MNKLCKIPPFPSSSSTRFHHFSILNHNNRDIEKMKHYSHGIDGLRSGLSPSAKPFAIGSSSSPAFSLKSEHEDSIWGDYTLDLSFLSSDDQRSGLDDDDSLSTCLAMLRLIKKDWF